MKLNTTVGNVQIKLNVPLDEHVRSAHKLLNLQIAADCDPLIPFRQGALRNSVNYPDGVYGDLIEYNTPYAHAIYEGYIFSPNIPIKDSDGNITGWFSPPGQKKQKTDRKMKFHTAGTTDHWFDEAKRQHGADWIRLVKDEVGKG